MNYQNTIRILLLYMFIMNAFNIFAQDEYMITGKVVNSNAEPVEGVSVSIDGQVDDPVITGEDGTFTISSKNKDFWVTFRPFEKYKPKRMFFSGSGEYSIYLVDQDLDSPDDLVLNIGEDRRRWSLSSSLFSVDTKNFGQLPFQSLDQSLQGIVPGLHFSNHSGLPGSGGLMLLRGVNSLNASNMPLVIVDGIPLEDGTLYNSLVTGASNNPLAAVSIKDISRISVIKGIGKSLYGAKGSNGVILVETLKPEATNTTIEFSFKTGFNLKGKELPQLNSRQFKTLASEVLVSTGLPEETYPTILPALYLTPDSVEYINYSHDYNWQEEVFSSNSTLQDAYISIMGGDAIGKYGLSISYMNYDGIFKNTGFNRFTSRFAGQFNMFEWLLVSVSANLVNSNTTLKESGLSSQASPVLAGLAKSPMQFPYKYDQNDEEITEIQDVGDFNISNPTSVMENFNASNSNTRFLTSFKLQANIVDALDFVSLLALNLNSQTQNSFYPNKGMQLYENEEVWNRSQSMSNNLFSIFNDNYFIYSKNISNLHHLDLIAGAKWATNEYEEDFAIANNLNPNDEFIFLQAGTPSLRDIGGGTQNWNWLSVYSRLNYSYKNKYLAELNVSTDLSSKIGREAPDVFTINNVPFGKFYSGGIAWRLSEEQFLENLDIIDDLRLNLQYGISGNDDVGSYNRQDFYMLKLFRETSGMVPSEPANPALDFEKSELISFGPGLSAFGGRVRLSVDFYKSNISNLLIYEKLNSYIGADEFPSNDASMVNRGMDLDIFSRIIKTGNFSFDLGVNLAMVENEITEIKNERIITQLPGFEIINEAGQSVNSFYGFKYEGVFSTEEEATIANLVNKTGIPFKAGDAKFSDISGPDGIPDGIINNYDKVVLGSGTPDLFGGMTVNLNYKRFNLNMLWQFAYGNEIFNYVRYRNERMVDYSNQSITTLRRWSYEEQVTDMPRANWADPVGNSSFSSRWIEDGSYLRCKYITLSYTFPEKLIIFRDLTVFGTMTNFFTFSKYLGYDPEFSFSYSPYTLGADYGLMPVTKSIIFGFNMGL